jgi:hypothetical protein
MQLSFATLTSRCAGFLKQSAIAAFLQLGVRNQTTTSHPIAINKNVARQPIAK